MASIDKEYEEVDWVKLTPDQTRRKSVTSEVSVTFVGDKYTNFEDLSIADMYNHSLKRGQKRAMENSDKNCGDRKRFCSLGVDFILQHNPSMEGLFKAISEDFANVIETVKQISLEKFISVATNEETQGVLELILKLRASVEQETLNCCQKMEESIMQNLKTDESEFKNRLQKLEKWTEVGSNFAEIIQANIAENRKITKHANISVKAKAEEMQKNFEKWHGEEINKMKESITQMQGVFTNLIVQQNTTQVQRMNDEVRDLEMKVGFFLANQSKIDKRDVLVHENVKRKISESLKNIEWLQTYVTNFNEAQNLSTVSSHEEYARIVQIVREEIQNLIKIWCAYGEKEREKLKNDRCQAMYQDMDEVVEAFNRRESRRSIKSPASKSEFISIEDKFEESEFSKGKGRFTGTPYENPADNRSMVSKGTARSFNFNIEDFVNKVSANTEEQLKAWKVELEKKEEQQKMEYQKLREDLNNQAIAEKAEWWRQIEHNRKLENDQWFQYAEQQKLEDRNEIRSEFQKTTQFFKVEIEKRERGLEEKLNEIRNLNANKLDESRCVNNFRETREQRGYTPSSSSRDLPPGNFESPFEKQNLSDGRPLNRPKVNENNWNMSQRINNVENEKGTGKGKGENWNQQQYTEKEEYREDNDEEMQSGPNEWQSYEWGKGKGKGKGSQVDEYERKLKAMSSVQRQAFMAAEIDKEEKRLAKIRKDREAGKLPEDEEHTDIVYEKFRENPVFGTGSIMIDGFDVGDQISRSLAKTVVKMGHTKPVLTSEEKLKEAKYNSECIKTFFRRCMPAKPAWCKNPTQDPPDFKSYTNFDSWFTDLLKWKKSQNSDIPDLWLIDFCVGRYEKSNQHIEFNRALEQRMERVCRKVEIDITFEEFFSCLEQKWLLTEPQRKAEAERKFSEFESWAKRYPDMGLSEKWSELRKRERNLLLFGVTKLWNETVEVFLNAIGRKENEHIKVYLYTEQMDIQNDDAVCAFLRQYEINITGNRNKLGLSQSGRDPKLHWNGQKALPQDFLRVGRQVESGRLDNGFRKFQGRSGRERTRRFLRGKFNLRRRDNDFPLRIKLDANNREGSKRFNLKGIKRVEPFKYGEQKVNLTYVGDAEEVYNATDENDCVLDLEYESDNDESDDFESDEEVNKIAVDDHEIQVNLLQANSAYRKRTTPDQRFKKRCFKCKKVGHLKINCPEDREKVNYTTDYDKWVANISCHKCKRKGHLKKDCPNVGMEDNNTKGGTKNQKGAGKGKGNVNNTEESPSGETPEENQGEEVNSVCESVEVAEVFPSDSGQFEINETIENCLITGCENVLYAILDTGFNGRSLCSIEWLKSYEKKLKVKSLPRHKVRRKVFTFGGGEQRVSNVVVYIPVKINGSFQGIWTHVIPGNTDLL